MQAITEWFSGDVVANGQRIHYYRSGTDGPQVVLAHGITDSGLCWLRVGPLLAREYDVITYDARGHGESETPRSGFSGADQAADLAGLVKALELDEPILIGHSMGANTVALSAAHYPGLMRAIVLEDPPWREQTYAPTASAAERYRDRLAEYQSMDLEALVAFGRQYRVGWAEEEYAPWALAKHQCRPEALSRMTGLGPPWQETARQISCPVLLLTGDPTVQAKAGLGAIVTHEIAQQALELLKDGRVAHISGAGHNIRREGFDSYMSAVVDFLQIVNPT